ncbi:MAG TPA: 3-dehydro-scyllo-inosose hydrolase [Candidatus Bathyarchaeia archaeon]|nr:3-dehydro-scyllo-inosose hydrolase [Candidatus Bathyarchaeia archaeon]
MSNWNLPPSGGHMEKQDGIYLQNMTMKQVEERLKKNDLIIIPLGATENHGPHAPIGEDIYLVCRMAELVAERTGCTVAQPLWYGSHPYHHVGMPGTVLIDDDAFKATVRGIMAGLWNTGFRKQILFNAHGQEYVIPSAIHQFAKKFQVPGIFINVDWWHISLPHIRDKEHGGPFDSPFIHADEVESSYSLALFPELMHMEDAVDAQVYGFLPNHARHVDKAANAYQRPIAWYGQVGAAPMEIYAYPKGVVGKATLAKAEKAYAGVRAVCDYMVELHNDIMTKFPAGTLPPVEQVTQRGREEIDAVVKGPLKGGRHIYTLAYPP